MSYSRSATAFALVGIPLLLVCLLIVLVSTGAPPAFASSPSALVYTPKTIHPTAQSNTHGLTSPTGRWSATVSVPPGAQTAHLATTSVVDLDSNQVAATFSGHSPRWSEDGASLFILRSELDGTVLTYRHDLATAQTSVIEGVAAASFLPNWQQQASALPTSVQASNQITLPTYPETIRVLHHPQNGCRSVEDWQIDVIPFEEYVARAIPAEVPASWPAAALEAQAVAARTYAWHQILVGRAEYDVTDWANFQMMCDQRLPSTDAAVAQTMGVYLSAKDDPLHWPIVAMYSAENGHPTLENPNVSYLQAVPDLFSVGQARWGHGYGLSQWGAQRRAVAGHQYGQILAHYYSNVNLQSALEASAPLGALPRPPTDVYLPQGGLTWDVLAPANALTVTLSLEGVDVPSQTLTGSINFTGAAGLWRAPTHLAEQDVLTVTLWVDAQNQETMTLVVDRTAPLSPTVRWPEAITQTDFAFDVAVSDATLGLNQDWLWKGEALSHTVGSGRVVSDSMASNESAWSAVADVDAAGVWYGPYADDLPHGHRYRVLFWLRAGLPVAQSAGLADSDALGLSLPRTPVARLDVTDHEGETTLGLRDLWLSDFAGRNAPQSDVFEPIAVDFYLFDKPEGVEFRVAWPGLIDLALDRVELWVLPDETWLSDEKVQWQLPPGAESYAMHLVAFDDAGNVSTPNGRLLDVRDETAPQLFFKANERIWLSDDGGEVRIGVLDPLSGVDINGARFTIVGASVQHEVSVIFDDSVEPWAKQQVVAQVDALPQGEYVGLFEVADRAGNVATSEEVAIYVGGARVYIPLVQLQ